MNILWLAFLVSCAQGRASVDVNQEVQNDVSVHLGNQLLSLNLLAPEHDVSADDEFLIQQLSTRQGRSMVADAIRDALENFREVIINGSDSLPPLDPFTIDVIGPFYYMVTGVRATAVVNNFRMEGLSSFVVDRVNFNALRLAFGAQITIPRITVTGSYDTRATVLFISHRARGDFRVIVNGLEVAVDLRLGTNLLGGHLVLRELDIKIDINDTFVNITGMTGSTLLNNFISSVIQTVSQELVQSQLENVSSMLSEELFDVINEILKEFTLADILG